MATRATRVKAAELAAQCLGAELAAGGATAGRLFALVIFFEIYIERGANAVQEDMRLLGSRRRGKLRVVAGGNLEATHA